MESFIKWKNISGKNYCMKNVLQIQKQKSKSMYLIIQIFWYCSYMFPKTFYLNGEKQTKEVKDSCYLWSSLQSIDSNWFWKISFSWHFCFSLRDIWEPTTNKIILNEKLCSMSLRLTIYVSHLLQFSFLIRFQKCYMIHDLNKISYRSLQFQYAH